MSDSLCFYAAFPVPYREFPAYSVHLPSMDQRVSPQRSAVDRRLALLVQQAPRCEQNDPPSEPDDPEA